MSFDDKSKGLFAFAGGFIFIWLIVSLALAGTFIWAIIKVVQHFT